MKERFYALSAQTGATRADSWVDIEGGIGTLFTYASLGSRELPDDTLWPEDELIPLSKEGGFAARHVLTSKSGVAVHINAFNFPCWGMLEKLAPTWLGGMPAIIKPATATAQLTQAMVKSIVDSGLVPEGAISLICGSAGDLLIIWTARCGDFHGVSGDRTDAASSAKYRRQIYPLHYGS